jgi:Protein of unknown function (DUF1425)
MKTKLSLLALVFALSSCTTIIETGNKIEKTLSPPDAVNYVTTKPDGGFTPQINDQRFGDKIQMLAVRKSKLASGCMQVQFDLRNGSYLGQTVNVSFEWLGADGSITERQGNWMTTPLEPGALTTITAVALKPESTECRLRVLASR